jgi:glyoxylase-like metal-dependent hydrolase (beta-lactamase superfamily II)
MQPRATVIAAIHAAALLVGATPASAQLELSGAWVSQRHEDLPDRGPGVGLGDYTGIPLNDAGRLAAESWDASSLSSPEQQCRVHVAHYIYRGPMNLRIWEERDPRTQEVLAIKHYISTYEQTRTIWMDGRAHPPPYAPHTWMGFSTGRWDGDRLVVETTHIKAGWHRRNGVPASDWTTMTEHFIRHGDRLTQIQVIRDPVYLAETEIKSNHFTLNPRALPQRSWLWPCQSVVEVATRDVHDVPHFLPGENPYLESSRREANLPLDGAQGGVDTIYPEWRKRRDAGRSREGVVRPRPAQSAVRVTVPQDDDIHTWRIRDNVFMLVSRVGNATLQLGEDGALIVDTMNAAVAEKLLAAIRELTNKPIRYVVNTHAHMDRMGGNAVIAAAGSTRTGGVVVAQAGADIADTAAVLAHENVLARVSAPTGEEAALPYHAWPSETFFNERRDFAFNDEGVIVLHLPAAHTDGDSIVFFRRSDVMSVGDLYSSTAYPMIDRAAGGSVKGYIAALNKIIDLAVPAADHQGGTMIVPGSGRLSDEFDVVEYRDMLVMVRDRIAALMQAGKSLAQIQAQRPTFDFDARYGAESGAWTTEMFVEAIYLDLAEGA